MIITFIITIIPIITIITPFWGTVTGLLTGTGRWDGVRAVPQGLLLLLTISIISVTTISTNYYD